MSLWVQLVNRCPDVNFSPSELRKWYEAWILDRSPSYKDGKKLKLEIFSRTISQVGKTILILDGFDEVPETQQQVLLESLQHIQKEATQCRILITSRPYTRIREMFKGNKQLEMSENQQDIELYIMDRMNRQQERSLGRKIRNLIRSELHPKCQGDFLLAKLYMDDVLRTTDDRTLKDVIRNLPLTAAECYEQRLERLQQQDSSRGLHPCSAIQALFWTVFSKAPMSEQELKTALAVKVGDKKYDKLGEPKINFEALCGGLVRRDPRSNEIRIIHKTFADHLQHAEAREKWFPTIQEHIPKILLTYLSFKRMNKSYKDDPSRAKLRNKYPLAPYALRYWGEGLSSLLKRGTDLWRLTDGFLRSSIHNWNSFLKHEVANIMVSKAKGWRLAEDTFTSGTISGLHWVATFGISDFIPVLQDHERQSQAKKCVSMTPLGLAAAHNQNRVVEELLETGVDVNDVGVPSQPLRPPLYDAVFHRNLEATKLLLMKGADMTLRRIDNDESPLDLAYVIGRERVAKLLAASISGKLPTRAQELQFLVRGAFASELQKAVDDGLDVNHPCENGKLALDYAHELGYDKVISILKSKGAEAKLPRPSYAQTPPSPYPLNNSELTFPGNLIVQEKNWGLQKCATLYCRTGGEDVEFENEARERLNLIPDHSEDDSDSDSIFSEDSSGSESDSLSMPNSDSEPERETNAVSYDIRPTDDFELKRRITSVTELLEEYPGAESDGEYESDSMEMTIPTRDIACGASEVDTDTDIDDETSEFGGHGSSFDIHENTSLLLLEVPLREGIELPIQTIIFETISSDQGWSSHENHGTYLGSTRSWFDVSVSNPEGESKALRVQHNVHASERLRLHTNIWRLDDLKNTAYQRTHLMQSIRHGSTLKFYAHAWGGVGWRNNVAYARVQIFDSSKEICKFAD